MGKHILRINEALEGLGMIAYAFCLLCKFKYGADSLCRSIYFSFLKIARCNKRKNIPIYIRVFRRGYYSIAHT